MKNHLLREKLRENIGDNTVVAAVFFTFNFDAQFFEDYLLPLCMDRTIDFSDNHIHNKILWQQHQDELPPVAVFCDFYAKSDNSAPTLDYAVHTADVPQHFFHPKIMFFLCEDSKGKQNLLVSIGSGNISFSGCCRNKECFALMQFLPGKKRLSPLPTELQSFLKTVHDKFARSMPQKTENHNPCEQIVAFLNNCHVQTDDGQHLEFYSSLNSSFFTFLKQLQVKYNDQKSFRTLEIISPYFSDSPAIHDETSAIQKFYQGITTLSQKPVKVMLPYSQPSIANITEVFYQGLVKDNAYQWASCKEANDKQPFRFTHAKIYRLIGETHCITIIGSVNFSQKGFKGLSIEQNFDEEIVASAIHGNYEAALAIVEPLEKVGRPSTLSFFTNKEPHGSFLTSGAEQDENGQAFDRVAVPPLSFTIDWSTKKLEYSWDWENDKPKDQCTIKTLAGAEQKLRPQAGTINLSEESLMQYSLQPLVTVVVGEKKRIVMYYAFHKNFSSKPIPPQHQISTRAIFDSWANLATHTTNEAGKDRVPSEALYHYNENDEFDLTLAENETPLNFMAQHLSALQTLHGYFFRSDKKLRQDHFEQIDHYLFSERYNSLPHYCHRLKEFREDERAAQQLSLGSYWLLLHIIYNNFYPKHHWLNARKSAFSSFLGWLKKEIQTVEKNLDVNKKFITWAKKQL